MSEPITRYRAHDGKEYHKKEDADEHNAYLAAESMVRSGWGGYSIGYDGPMPVPAPPTAEQFFRERAKLRNIFLDLPEPMPKVVIKTEYQKVYHYPLTLMGVMLLVGLVIGGVWF